MPTEFLFFTNQIYSEQNAIEADFSCYWAWNLDSELLE